MLLSTVLVHSDWMFVSSRSMPVACLLPAASRLNLTTPGYQSAQSNHRSFTQSSALSLRTIPRRTAQHTLHSPHHPAHRPSQPRNTFCLTLPRPPLRLLPCFVVPSSSLPTSSLARCSIGFEPPLSCHFPHCQTVVLVRFCSFFECFRADAGLSAAHLVSKKEDSPFSHRLSCPLAPLLLSLSFSLHHGSVRSKEEGTATHPTVSVHPTAERHTGQQLPPHSR